MNRVLLALFALLALAGVTWVVTSDSKRSIDPGQGRPDVQTSPDEAVAETRGAAQLESADANRAALSNGHRVRVLDLAGLPVAGLAVQFLPGSAETLIEYREATATIDWPRPETEFFTTDAQGEVVIPSSQLGVASALTLGASGYVICDAGASQQAHELQLQPDPMVEVLVQHADGQPAQGQFEFLKYTASAAAAAELPSNAGRGDWRMTWLEDGTAGLLADGRRAMRLSAEMMARSQLGPDVSEFAFKLRFSAGAAATELQDVDANRTEAVVFRLPEVGSLILQLDGAPSRIFPVVHALFPQSRSRVAGPSHPGFPTDNRWRFDNLPTGVPLRVGYSYSRSQDRTTGNVSTTLLGPDLNPIAATTSAREDFVQFEWPAGFHGQLVVPDELTSVPSSYIQSLQAASLRSEVLSTTQSMKSAKAAVTLLPDGQFHVAMGGRVSGGLRAEHIDGFSMAWSEVKEVSTRIGRVQFPTRAWAIVPASTSDLQSSVDVGEVPLRWRDPLLRLRVVDDAGQAVAGAKLEFFYRTEYDVEHREANYFHDSRSSRMTTDDQGEAWVLEQDWYSFLATPPPGSASQYSGPLTELQVRVEAAGMAARVQSVNLNAREVEVRLAAGGSIAGSVLMHPALTGCRAILLERDEKVDDDDIEGITRRSISFYKRELGEAVQFEIESIPAGNYDLAIEFGSLDPRPYIRFNNIAVSAGAVTRDVRLQEVDLAPHLPCLTLRLVGPNGQPLSPKQVKEARFRIYMPEEYGGMDSNAQAYGDALYVHLSNAIPEGESPYLQSPLYKPVSLLPAVAGEREIQLVARRIFRLAVIGLDELPQGATVDLGFRDATGETGLGSTELRRVSAEGAEIQLPGPGNYSVRWEVEGFQGKWKSDFSTRFELSDADFASGGTIQMKLPKELIDKFPDSD